ncbi:hypothetical protein [uncultured Oscillibacter sp.]|uniref:hypothetical protein n=1 Tax=uncultured Oscillibacter sp. TaxID=876091 RepID=UPI0025D8BFCC|nr:hypothetical protein [uncultured Oscillibacter sp.]
MDKFPMLLDGRAAGELIVEQEALYTWFDARCRLPEEGRLWCAWAVGEKDSLRLGVLEPSGQEAVIRRRFSRRMTEPLGRLLRGEVRPAAEEDRETWQAVPDAETLFRAPWLRKRLQGIAGALVRTDRGRRFLALPYDSGKPFPLPTLFCFASIRSIHGERYAVFVFDGEDRPVFP